jgi:enamine deaminase RidA (YjgF/YER057c/UK114 family)
LGRRSAITTNNQEEVFFMGKIAAKLAELSIELPEAAAPAANYVPFVQSGNLLFISGQLPFEQGQLLHNGRLGADISIEQGYQAARQCAINIIAQIKAAGALEKVTRIVKVGGFVNSTADFTSQPQVVNGASDLFVAIFGDAGRHARAAVGVPALPRGVSVEVDAVVEIEA